MGKDLAISYLFECYGGLLTDKQRRIVDMYYNADLSLAEIAKIENITRQGVQDAKKQAVGKLYDCENKMRLRRKIEILRYLMNEKKYADVRRCLDNFFCEWDD